MKVTVLQENLVKGVTAVSRMTTTGGQLPILSHILIKARKGGLYLSGTNLEISVTLKLGAKVEKEGAFAVPAKVFSEFVSSLQAGKVQVLMKKEQLEIKSGESRAVFQGMSANEYPDVPVGLKKEGFSFKKGFEEAVSQVVMAAAVDESRPVLTGVQMKKEGGKMRLVATDGYRLSIRWVGYESKKLGKGEKTKDKVWVVPAKALLETATLIKSFGSDNGVKVGLNSDGNQLVFEFADVVLGTRLIEGEFPPFEHIVPEKGEVKVRFDAEPLQAAARMAAIFARESANIVKWQVGKGQVVIQANSPQVGGNESKVDVKIEPANGTGEIAFNSRYLLDYLGSVGEGEIVFEMGDSLSPGLFKVEGKGEFLHVIMPVRVQKD